MNQTTAANKPVVIMLAATLALMLAIPAGLVSMLPKREQPAPHLAVATDDMKIKVLLKEKNQVVEMPLEEYVKGVVAAEMPADFPLEALKAQAIAARTNAIRRIQKNSLIEGAHVTDDYRDTQAYSSDEKLKQQWGIMEYQLKMNKIVQAVNETKGQIVTYNGVPIDAMFFSASNGKTEDSQDYFGRALPYLRSVDCPWDAQSKHATRTKTMPLQEFHRLLGINAVVTAANQGQMLQVVETSASHRVKKIRVAGKVMSGPDFRQALGLPSTDFSWKIEGDAITFTTHGNGHGVGMSQYGAEGMAKQGKTASEILAYFYQGTTIASYKKP
ncbi:stage II sporulation protein D [Effusibacillus pohliae]|uniref:stage II sporulation protein D n=1 Tax=Effusibacillus pohliae TaxID=232270 RepID=UPI00035DAA70|nr:stage II sporulation protein D [Effusibacillus pohliae]